MLAYRIWKHLSKKLIKKGVIEPFRSRRIDKGFLPPEPMEVSRKKFFSLKMKENTVKTLVIGSSHGYYGFVADDGYNEFNAADTSQDLYYSYEIYKKFADAPKLKNVVLFYSVFSPGFSIELTEEKFRSDFYRYIWDIPYRFTPDGSRPEALKEIALFVQNEKPDASYVGNCAYSFFMGGISTEERVGHHLKHNRRRQNQTEYVRKAALLAKEKGHDFYVVIPPHRSDYTKLLPPFEEVFPELLALKNDVKIVSFLGDERFEDSDFGDMDHLNRTGAEKCTALVREILSRGE